MHAYSEDDTQSIESQTVIDDTVVILTTDTQSANDVHSRSLRSNIQLNLKLPGGQNSSSCLSRDPRDPPQA